jgi:hypothetical protein
VNNRRIGGPAAGDFSDRQVFLEPQPQQLDAMHGLCAVLLGPLALQLTGLGHDGLRPRPVEEAGLAGIVRRDFR